MKTYEHRGPSVKNMRLLRLFAVLFDAALCLILGIGIFILMWLCLGLKLSEIVRSPWQIILDSSAMYMTLFFFKDIFGRSIGKAIFGLYIVERDTDRRAPFNKRFFRNFSLMLFPIEGAALLISETNTRIADKLFEIEVVAKK